MGTHVKSMTKVLTLPAVAAASVSAAINTGSLIPTGIIIDADGAGKVGVQVSFDGTKYFQVEEFTTSTTETYFPLSYAKYFGATLIKISATTSNILVGGKLILCEV